MLRYQTYEILKDSNLLTKEEFNDWVHDLKTTTKNGNYVLHVPNSYQHLASLDPIIDENDKKQGFVKWSDIEKYYPEISKKFIRLVTDDPVVNDNKANLLKLKNIIETVSSPNTQNTNVNVYLVETSWWSGVSDENVLDRNIKVDGFLYTML